MASKHLKELQASRLDSAVSIAKGLVGALPFGGAMFAEIIEMTIPNQRLDRVTAFLVELDRRLSSIERETLKVNKFALDLFEDGVVQAARALTEDRNRYIAIFIKKSVGVNEDSYRLSKKLFYILQELSDRDIAILEAISARGYHWAATHYSPMSVTIGQYKSFSEQERHEYDSMQVLWSAHKITLERLGLIEEDRQKPERDDPTAHIDRDTGLPRLFGYSASRLGKILLQTIGE